MPMDHVDGFLDILRGYLQSKYASDIPARRPESVNVGFKSLLQGLLMEILEYTNDGKDRSPVIDLSPEGRFGTLESHPSDSRLVEDEGILIRGKCL